MKKLIILLVIIVIQLIRYYASDFKKSRHLLVSFFIISVPFQIAFPLYKNEMLSGAGTIGPVLNFLLPLALFLVLLPVYKLNAEEFKIKNNKWTLVFIIIAICSFLNIHNQSKFTSLIFVSFVVSHILLFKLIFSNIDKHDLIKGIFDGLVILCFTQLILAICYPLLGIKAVTGLFFEAAEGWATRMGTRPGAVGTFTHPGNLSLFSTIAASFFLACYLTNYNKKISILLVTVNFITVILTFSRTSYLTIIFDLLFVYFIFKNAHRDLFSTQNLFKFVLPTLAVTGWIIFFSPLSDLFLKSDADEMYTARLMHWIMGLEVFQNSPWVGAGLNAHLEYFAKHSLTLNSIDLNNPFLIANPIHNIHLIVLAENGLIGFITWIVFIGFNIGQGKNHIAANNGHRILPLTFIGLLVGFSIYGMTGWAPLSPSLLPLLLFFSYFSMRYSI